MEDDSRGQLDGSSSQWRKNSVATRCRKLRDRSSGFAKDYLRSVVDEIRVEGNAATISGSYERLIAAVAKENEDTDQVPSFMRDWRRIANSHKGRRTIRCCSPGTTAGES